MICHYCGCANSPSHAKKCRTARPYERVFFKENGHWPNKSKIISNIIVVKSDGRKNLTKDSNERL